jgi:hypothetical protein
MEKKQLSNWRENVTADLTEVKTDVKWIKDNLRGLDVRQSELTRQVSWLRGLGSIVGVILGSVLALVSSVVFGK